MPASRDAPRADGCSKAAYHDAAVIRRGHDSFSAVSVDADQRPDLGARFEPWGWPATLFFCLTVSRYSHFKVAKAPASLLSYSMTS